MPFPQESLREINLFIPKKYKYFDKPWVIYDNEYVQPKYCTKNLEIFMSRFKYNGIRFLKRCLNLKELWIPRYQRSIKVLSKLTKLTTLILDGFNRSLEPLRPLKKLRELSLDSYTKLNIDVIMSLDDLNTISLEKYPMCNCGKCPDNFSLFNKLKKKNNLLVYNSHDIYQIINGEVIQRF